LKLEYLATGWAESGSLQKGYIFNCKRVILRHVYSSEPLWALLAKAAARSNCPPTAGGFLTPGFGGTGLEEFVGRWAVGIGGLPGILGGPPPPPDTCGFEAIGGGPGFGFVATGGGPLANEEFGRELAGELSVESR